jgi:hypothetical protein
MHAYDGVTIKQVNGRTCLVPSGEIAHDSTQVTLADYKDTNGDGKVGFGDTASLSISFSSPTGFAYVNIHLDYGLKGTTGWSKGGTNGNDAISGLVPALQTVKDYATYTFSETDGQPDSQTVSSRNEFKKNPGVAGLVQQIGTFAPIPNAQVVITGDGKSTTVTADQDGWYMWSYKYTGKATSFTVKLLPSGLTQTVTVKSNGFVVANPFLVP